ncbi:MAG: hypothetical protein U5K28_05245 [Halobacteriales archaeon]|nr:hypothetical protein [Halobacteriales archaeon]
MGLVGHFLAEGRFSEASEYVDIGTLVRPKDIARLAFWSVLGLRALAAGRER